MALKEEVEALLMRYDKKEFNLGTVGNASG